MEQKLILIALYSILFIEVWSRTAEFRGQIVYRIKKFFRPFIIKLGGLNERTRAEREVKRAEFLDSANTEKHRPEEGIAETQEKREGERGGPKNPNRGHLTNLEILGRRR